MFKNGMCQVPLLVSKPEIEWFSRHQFAVNFSPGSSSLVKSLITPFFSISYNLVSQLDLCFDHISRIAGPRLALRSLGLGPNHPSAARHDWIHLLASPNSEYCLLPSTSVNEIWSSAKKHMSPIIYLFKPLSPFINTLSWYHSSSEFLPFKAKSTLQMRGI